MEKKPTARAGTLESNDIMITLSAAPDAVNNSIALSSIVMQQFGPAITATIEACLQQAGLRNVQVDAQDKGALECTIKARMEAAILRYKEQLS